MNMFLCRLLLCLAACSLPALPASADTTVRSLSQVRGAIKTADARAAFDREMSGAPAPDGFGQQLPSGFTKDFLALQLAPGRDLKRLVLAGAKPWPQRSGMYVGAVCLAASPGLAVAVLRYPVRDCKGFDNNADNEIWFGVFERGADNVPRLVARIDTLAPLLVDHCDGTCFPELRYRQARALNKGVSAVRRRLFTALICLPRQSCSSLSTPRT